jgi:hypothetical protein
VSKRNEGEREESDNGLKEDTNNKLWERVIAHFLFSPNNHPVKIVSDIEGRHSKTCQMTADSYTF